MKSAPACCRLRAVCVIFGSGDGPVPWMAGVLSSILELLSMMMWWWSWSFVTGVAWIILWNRSAVASGPIPPRIPMIFSPIFVLE